MPVPEPEFCLTFRARARARTRARKGNAGLMNIVFFGTPKISADVLTFLLEHGIQVSAIVTKPDKAHGRTATPQPSPVKVVGVSRGIPVHQPEKASAIEFAEILRSYQADLFVVVAYGEIIKQHLLDMPRLGCINVHVSLLPKYRGAAPIERAIIEGEKETGVTIMYMVKKLDAGDIISTSKVPIDENITAGELTEKLGQVGSKTLLDVIHCLEKGIVNRISQEESQATYASKIELEDCEVNWSLPAEKIHNLIRGVNPEPGAWCYVEVKGQKKRLKLIRSKMVKELSGLPGSILQFGKEGIVIACGNQAVGLLELQLEGKKVMPAEQFVRGMQKEAIHFY